VLSQGLVVEELKNWIEEHHIQTSVKLRKKEGEASISISYLNHDGDS
jgi:hypothetical protein